VSSEEKARIKGLERENRELRQANEILKKASAYFAPPLGDCIVLQARHWRDAITCRAMGRSSTARSANDRLYLGSSRSIWGRADLQGATDHPVHCRQANAHSPRGTYYHRMAVARDPTLASSRARSDTKNCAEIDRVWKANRSV